MIRVIRVLLVSLVLWAPLALADEFTSSSFKVLDPVVFPSGYSTSSTYSLWGTVSQLAIGTSTSAGFQARSGFLYFPAPTSASTPAPTPTGGGAGGGGILGMVGLLFKPPRTLPPVPFQISKCGVSDFNCDEATDLADISSFLFLIGYSPYGNPADVNSDGSIDLVDASIMLSHWSGAAYVAPSFPTGVAPSERGGEAGTASVFIAQGGSRGPGGGLQKETISVRKAEAPGRIIEMLAKPFTFISDVVLRVWRFLINIAQ